MLVHCPNENFLALAAAKLFVEQFHRAVNLSGHFDVVLSGGSTPRRTYEYLATDQFKKQVDWSKINIFWGDERCVELSDPRSNYLMAHESLLSHVPIPTSQIHPMFCSKDPHESAVRYEKLLRNHFKKSLPCFDLAFLGLGGDGHIASLFPFSSALNEKGHWVTAVQKENEHFARITLTLPIFNLAKMIVFLVAGKEKSEILQKVLTINRSSTKLPAQLIQPINGKLLWLVDSSTNF
ncbi:MAG: 6-phosphogluconolactonase [Bacteriovorax sp.]